jgi:putative ubiquitin-RnfH superfamily antitoxin RatB of RatAB toxin-antitoxin module
MFMADRAAIQVQICYAQPGVQILRDLTMPEGSTLHDAVKQSGILQELPEIDLTACRVGIFGKLKDLDTVLRDRDRVEIYRPLIADPKESRRMRAEKKGSKKAEKLP